MTTIHVPYTCGKCRNQFEVIMKAGEPLISMTCPKCRGIATAPPF